VIQCYLVYFQVKGLKINKTILFHIVFCILELLGGRSASLFVAGRLSFFSHIRSCSQIDFSDSLTV